MNIKDYIASGILEQYALGLTSEKDSEEVERYVRQHPELLAELHAVQDALLRYNSAFERMPPRSLEQAILNRIGPSEKQPTSQPAAKTETGTARGARYRRAVMMAGLSLLLALVALGYLFQQNKSKEKALARTTAELEQLRTDCENIRNNNTRMAHYIAAVGDPGNKAVVMKGLDIAPSAVAIVHWNQTKKQAFIEVKDLPPAPAGKQYQLWAIVGGKPTDMGVFTLQARDNDLKTVPFIANPEAFAVTLEDEGGSPVPTLDQMYLLGKV